MNLVSQGTPDSTLKTCWIKEKTYFRQKKKNKENHSVHII